MTNRNHAVCVAPQVQEIMVVVVARAASMITDLLWGVIDPFGVAGVVVAVSRAARILVVELIPIMDK